MSRGRWPAPAFALLALGIAILALPSRWEGPTLLPISPGHAIAALDAVGILPLVGGTILLYGGLWQRRALLADTLRRAPGAGAAWLLLAGFGMGLLFASAFSTFWWWWAVGAVLVLAAFVAAVAAALR